MAERRRYSDEFRANALAALAANGDDIPRAAHQLGIHPETLRNWVSGRRHPEARQMAERTKKEMAQEMRRIVWEMLGKVEGKVRNASLVQTTTAIGTLVDKAQLLDDEPTSITKQMDDVKDDELDRRIRDVQARLFEPGPGETPTTGAA